MTNYLKSFLKNFNKVEMRILPGNMAFYFVLAIIPLLTMIVWIASYFSISIESVFNLIKNVVPKEVSSMIIESLSGRSLDTGMGVFNISAFLVASNGTYAIVNAANTLYEVENTDTLRDRIKAVFLLILVILLILFILLVPIFGNKILMLLNFIGISNFDSGIMFVFNFMKWPISYIVVYINLKIIYTLAPSILIKSKTTTRGALFTATSWMLLTGLFSLYIDNFADYDVIYGNLSSLVILMLWIYFICYIFVMGLVLNRMDKSR